MNSSGASGQASTLAFLARWRPDAAGDWLCRAVCESSIRPFSASAVPIRWIVLIHRSSSGGDGAVRRCDYQYAGMPVAASGISIAHLITGYPCPNSPFGDY